MTKGIPASKKRVKSTEAGATTPAGAPTAAAKKAVRASAATPAPAVPAQETTPSVPTKAKLVRDSFTIPKPEYDNLAALKRRALALGIEAKKSELIRAGIAAMTSMPDAKFLSTVKSVPNLKTGRPKSSTV